MMLPGLDTPMTVVHVATIVATVIGVGACVVFIARYRPLNPYRHSDVGRHLLGVTYGVLVLFVTFLLGLLTTIPAVPLLILRLVVTVMITYEMLHRNLILVREKRARDRQGEPDRSSDQA